MRVDEGLGEARPQCIATVGAERSAILRTGTAIRAVRHGGRAKRSTQPEDRVWSRGEGMISEQSVSWSSGTAATEIQGVLHMRPSVGVEVACCADDGVRVF